MPLRPRPTLARLLTRAVLTTFAVTTGGALLAVGSTAMTDAPEQTSPPRSAPVSEPVATPESRMLKQYDCSTTGFGPEAEPQSAVVRTERGRARMVSFDEAWAIHTSGRSDVTLVAFCLRPADPPATVR